MWDWLNQNGGIISIGLTLVGLLVAYPIAIRATMVAPAIIDKRARKSRERAKKRIQELEAQLKLFAKLREDKLSLMQYLVRLLVQAGTAAIFGVGFGFIAVGRTGGDITAPLAVVSALSCLAWASVSLRGVQYVMDSVAEFPSYEMKMRERIDQLRTVAMPETAKGGTE